jgi:hypothetical protein
VTQFFKIIFMIFYIYSKLFLLLWKLWIRFLMIQRATKAIDLKGWIAILYIKANMVSVRLSVWTKIGQCLEDSSSHCPFPVELVTNRAGAGQGGQGSRCGGPREVPFLLKKSLGKTGGPASNQTKIQFF